MFLFNILIVPILKTVTQADESFEKIKKRKLNVSVNKKFTICNKLQ